MSATPDRQLGLMERLSVARHNVGLFMNLVTGSRYRLAAGIDVTRLFESALQICVAEHPFLSAVLLDDTTNAVRWGRLDRVDVTSLIQWREEGESLDDVLAELHCRPFPVHDKSRPLWYLVLLPQEETVHALFVNHHAFCDGIGALAFHRTLHRALNQSLARKSEGRGVDTQLSPPMDELIDCRPGWLLILRTVLAELILPTWIALATGLRRSYFVGRHKTCVVGEVAQTCVRTLRAEPGLFQPLLLAAKRAKVTLTAFMWAALASAVSRSLRSEPEAIYGQIAIDLRPICRPEISPNVISNINAGVGLTAPPPFIIAFPQPTGAHSAEQLLNASRMVSKELRKPNMRQRAAEYVGLLSFVPQKDRAPQSNFVFDTGLDQFLRRQGQEGKRVATFEISNLGVFRSGVAEMSSYLEDMVFSQSCGALAALLQLSTITCRGVLHCSFTWQRGALGEAEVTEIVEHFLSALKLLAQDVK